MNRFLPRPTYANVVSTLCLFLLLGGASAFAATQLAKNSVGTKQLKKNAVATAKIKKNAVTTAKLKKNAITSAKIKGSAVTTAKIKDNAVTGSKVNASTLGTVPVSATTESVKSGHGTLSLGQEQAIFEYGPLQITMKCEIYEVTAITSRFYISSSTTGSVFTSWKDEGSNLGPETPESERELNSPNWASSIGPFTGEPPFDTGGSATATSGQAFNFWIGEGAEKDTNTCYYWLTANILS